MNLSICSLIDLFHQIYNCIIINDLVQIYFPRNGVNNLYFVNLPTGKALIWF